MPQPEGREISFPTGHGRRVDRSQVPLPWAHLPEKSLSLGGGLSSPPAVCIPGSSWGGQSQAVCPTVLLCFIIHISISIIIIIFPYFSFLLSAATWAYTSNEVSAL